MLAHGGTGMALLRHKGETQTNYSVCRVFVCVIFYN